MDIRETILEKLSTKNIIALSTTGLVLATVYQFITNPDKLLVTITDNSELVIGGSVVFGIVLAKWSDIIQHFFRKGQPKVEE